MVSPPCWKRVKIVHRGRRSPPNDNMLSVKQLCTRSKALTVALGDDQATADPLTQAGVRYKTVVSSVQQFSHITKHSCVQSDFQFMHTSTITTHE